jgi:hypothetical protein
MRLTKNVYLETAGIPGAPIILVLHVDSSAAYSGRFQNSAAAVNAVGSEASVVAINRKHRRSIFCLRRHVSHRQFYDPSIPKNYELFRNDLNKQNDEKIFCNYYCSQ